MKFLVFCVLAALLLFSTQAGMIHWEELSASNLDPISRDLLEVAVGHVIQKGKFESTKAPFPGDYYQTDYDSIQYERKNTSKATYYKYDFLLEEDGGPAKVNSTVIVSYDPKNANFIVINYRYTIDYNEYQHDGEGKTTSRVAVDTRTFTGDGDDASLLSDSMDSIVAGHIERGTLPNDEYIVHHVYRAEVSDSGENEVNEGFKYYSLWVKIRSSEGKFYLMEVVIDIPKENGELVFDKARVVGSIMNSDLPQQ